MLLFFVKINFLILEGQCVIQTLEFVLPMF